MSKNAIKGVSTTVQFVLANRKAEKHSAKGWTDLGRIVREHSGAQLADRAIRRIGG